MDRTLRNSEGGGLLLIFHWDMADLVPLWESEELGGGGAAQMCL